MSKSLAQVAKQILMKESNDPTPDRGATTKTPNAQTLAPMSRKSGDPVDQPKSLGGFQDLGPTPERAEDTPPSAKASGATKKDTSKSSKSAVAQEGIKQQAQVNEGEDMDEEFEISEELEAFIKEKIEEGLTEEEIAEAVDENFELVSEDLEEETETVQEETEITEEVPAVAIDMSEHVEAMLQGETLSEEFKLKAKTIFEAAVNQKLDEEVKKLKEAYVKTLEEEIESHKADLASQVDDYLNYVVEQWVKDNQVAVESGLRNELTEEFITGLRNLCAEHYIDIPESKIDVVEELGKKVNQLETELNEQIDKNVQMNKLVTESRKIEILVNETDELTDTQAEKIRSLAENVEFTTAEDFEKKVKTLKENYFPASVINKNNVLDVVDTSTSDKPALLGENTRMDRYVSTLGRKLPN